MTTFVFAYTDEHGIANDCTNNWNIGVQNTCVGCNKASGLKDNSWVVMKKMNGNYNLGFTGKLLQKQNVNFQPWEVAGGKNWKHIYTCSHTVWLGDMDNFCTQHGFDRTMFIKTLMFGHPSDSFKESFDEAARIVRIQYP